MVIWENKREEKWKEHTCKNVVVGVEDTCVENERCDKLVRDHSTSWMALHV